jgi:hypothetical protein
MLTDDVLDMWSTNRDELDRDELLWTRKSDGWHFYVLCNDFFGAGSDCEEIQHADHGALRIAIADCRDAGDASWGPLLWVSRKREIAPWFRRAKIPDEVLPLFQALVAAHRHAQ